MNLTPSTFSCIDQSLPSSILSAVSASMALSRTHLLGVGVSVGVTVGIDCPPSFTNWYPLPVFSLMSLSNILVAASRLTGLVVLVPVVSELPRLP